VVACGKDIVDDCGDATCKGKGSLCASGAKCVSDKCTALGSQDVPVASCKALQQADPAVESGVAWVMHKGKATPTWCDQKVKGGGWTLALKHAAGEAISDPHGDFMSGGNAGNVALLGTAKSADVSTGMGDLAGAIELLAVVYVGGKPVYTIGFKLKAGDLASTWQKSNFIGSLSSIDIGSYDSSLVLPNAGCGRFFYVTQQHGGCPNDAGSLVVTGNGSQCCGWQAPGKIYYWPGPGNAVNYASVDVKANGETILLYVR
jgi:hypothetical protein